MENKFIFITGFPGVGKETITDAICELTGARKIGGSGFSMEFFRIAGYPVNRIPRDKLQKIFDRMHEGFCGLFETAKHGMPGISHVFTNWLTDSEDGRALALMDAMYDVASHKGTRLVSIMLICTDPKEHMDRLQSEGRAEQFKLTDPHVAQNIFDEPVFVPKGAVVINTAGRDARCVAWQIINIANARTVSPVWRSSGSRNRVFKPISQAPGLGSRILNERSLFQDGVTDRPFEGDSSQDPGSAYEP